MAFRIPRIPSNFGRPAFPLPSPNGECIKFPRRIPAWFAERAGGICLSQKKGGSAVGAFGETGLRRPFGSGRPGKKMAKKISGAATGRAGRKGDQAAPPGYRFTSAS